ncbi:MAG: hypothetical protein HYV09_38130 [Deltaproteobacteria bacterium]|nr:hypothetical protein [Deltaproteobacteria bacterium]
MKKSLSVFAALALSHAVTNVASADAPATSVDASAEAPAITTTKLNAVNMALLAGHGFKDAFKTGFGGRVGYTLPSKLHLGGSFVYHVGTTEGLVQSNVWYAGGEVGYDVIAGPLVIRPYAGFGAASISASVTLPPVGQYPGGKASVSESRFAVWPGAMFLFPFEDGSAFVGVDAKFLVVDNASAFNTYGTFGLAF